MAATLPSDRLRKGSGTPKYHIDDTTTSQIQRSRRQWNIQDGPRGLLRRMRSELAEDGDPESQVVLAKTLLEVRPDDVTVDPVDCARQAVFWLSRASMQGHTDATALLQDCTDTDTGISEHNYHEVRQILNMDRQEKLARRAAQLLFARLSDGNDFVTSSMLTARIRDLLGEADQSNSNINEESSLEARYGGERFLEEHLTAAGTSYFQGHLPPLQHFLPSFKLDASSSDLRRSSGIVGLLSKAYDRLTSAVGFEAEEAVAPHSSNYRRGVDKVVKYLGVDLVRKIKYWYYGVNGGKIIMLLMMIFCLFTVFSQDTLLNIIPFVVILLSVMSMVVTTCTILMNYRQLDEFKVWSVVLNHYCNELSTESAERKFQNGWYVPYVGLFISLIAFISIKPFVSTFVIFLHLPLLVVLTLLAFSCSIKRVGVWQHTLLLLYQTTCMSYHISDVFIEYLNYLVPIYMHPYIDLIFIHKVNWSVMDIVNINLGVVSVIQLNWYLTILFCLMRKGWIPTATLLVSSAWFSVALDSLFGVDTKSNVLYACFIWFIVIVCPVIWKMIQSGLPVMCVLLVCLQAGITLEVTTGIVVSYMFLHYLMQRYFPTILFAIRQIVLWTAVIYLVVSNGGNVSNDRKTNLKWDSYHNMCVPSLETEARSMLACRRLEDMVVSWQGTVTDVTITSLSNWPEFFLPLLPLPEHIKQGITCYVGEGLTSCNRSDMSLPDYERCVLLNSVYGKETCSLDNWNVYEFSVTITMDSTYWKINKQSQSVIVTLSHRFKEAALALRPGENIDFEGSLMNGIGSKNLEVKGINVKCSQCKDSNLNSIDYNKPNSYYLFSMFSSVFNFFFSPTLSI